MDKTIETAVKDTHFSINTDLDHICLLHSLYPSWNRLWIVSSGILCFSWRRTSSGCLRDVGGGNLLLTLLSKTDHSCWMIFKPGNCAGQRRCWSASSCSSYQDWTLLAVCMDGMSSWKSAKFLGNIWTPQDAPGYLKCPRSHWLQFDNSY
jgi:hypothetical protein